AGGTGRGGRLARRRPLLPVDQPQRLPRSAHAPGATGATTGRCVMAVTTNVVVDVKDLRAYYVTKAYGVERTVRAVEGVSLGIRKNEVFGIAGESGCGKSTLLKALLGMTPPPLTILGGSVTYHADGGDVNVFALP